MRNILTIRKSTLNRIFLIHVRDPQRFFLVEKRDVARWLFFFGMVIALFGSALPWFLWPIAKYYQLIAFLPIAMSLALSHSLRQPIYTRTDYIYPTVALTLLLFIINLCSGRNINGFIMSLFSVVIFLSLFEINRKDLQRLGIVLTNIMAAILAVSIPFYILYLTGFSLPHYHVAPEAVLHTYENYRFFLIDDRFEIELIPRFISVFPEPSWLGMACVTLLFCQIGQWNTWRCRVLFLALAMTFSLAAYICAVIMLFASAYMKGKAILGKIVLLVSVIGAIGVGSIFYNRGDNLVNTLIVQRLTISNDGKLEGDNRATDTFIKEYDKMVANGEWVVGKGIEGMERFSEGGNSGYRVFVYTNGALSAAMLILFLATCLSTSDNRRAQICFCILMTMTFIAHGAPQKFLYFIPMYIFAFSPVRPKQIDTEDGSH